MKKRWLSIFLYFLSFALVFFVTAVIFINAYYFIPYKGDGINLDRTFTAGYYTLFIIVAFVFSLLMTYSFLSIFGMKSFKEVFDPARKKIVYVSSVLTFWLVYFIFELLCGYIILNIDDPQAFINGNSSSNIIVTSDKSYNNLHLNSTSNYVNMFYIDGNYIVNISDSNLINNGSGQSMNIGSNTIISAKNGARFNGDRVMLTGKGSNTQVLYFDNSTVNLINSNLSTEGDSSVVLFGNKGIIRANSTSFLSDNGYGMVFSNGTDAIFEKCNFGLSDKSEELFVLAADNMDSINKLEIRSSSVETADVNFIKTENSTNVINFEDVKINWDVIDKYLVYLNGSDVTINIKNASISGDIRLDDYSNLKMTLEGAQFSGNIIGDKGFELTIDDNSLFSSTKGIHLSKFNGSEIAFDKRVISLQNEVVLDTENEN